MLYRECGQTQIHNTMKTQIHNTMKTQIITALFATFTATALHASTIVGDTVQIRRELPSLSFINGPFATTVVSGPSDSISLSSANNIFVNPESSSILFNFGPVVGSGGGYADHRIIVSDIDWFGEPSLTLSSVTATSDIPGFSPSFVTFDAHSVTLSIRGFNWSGGQSVLVQLTPVPEPATMGLLLVGVSSLFYARRRRVA